MIYDPLFVHAPTQFQPVYIQSAVASVMCPDDYYLYYYYDQDNWTQCTTQYYSLVRLLFWVMGFLGKSSSPFLLCKVQYYCALGSLVMCSAIFQFLSLKYM